MKWLFGRKKGIDSAASEGIPEQQELPPSAMGLLMADRAAERKWRNIRYFVTISLVVLYALLILFGAKGWAWWSADDQENDEGYVALVRIRGMIGPDSAASAEQIIPLLRKAFEDKEAKGVVLAINSPGGTAVQSSLINERLKQLKQEHPNKPLVVVGEDVMASGAYMIASAADTIVVNRSSITGSIGVVAQNFGFVGLMEKLGVERRTQTAGEHKARLDPFSPQSAEDREKLHNLLGRIHQHFIDIVKSGRGKKLKGNDELLFSGDFWTGEEALALGLVDKLGGLADTLKSQFGTTRIREYRPSEGLLANFAKFLGIGASTAVMEHLETKQELPSLQ